VTAETITIIVAMLISKAIKLIVAILIATLIIIVALPISTKNKQQ